MFAEPESSLGLWLTGNLQAIFLRARMVQISRPPFEHPLASNASGCFPCCIPIAEGGLWVDAATSLIRPIDSWLDRRHSFQMLRRSHQHHPKFPGGSYSLALVCHCSKRLGSKWFHACFLDPGRRFIDISARACSAI